MCLRILAFCFILPLVLAPNSNGAEPSSVVFTKRPARPGDTSTQTIRCHLNLELSIRQAGQVVQARKQGLERKQQREVTILTVGENVANQALVSYDESTVSLKTTDDPAQPASQPVTGKTYRVVRHGDKLTITYENGQQPPEQELAIVRQNMESFGLPNPIAHFFSDRKMRINETIQLPSKVARELLGFPDTVGNITQFHLRLRETRNIKGSQAAVFDIKLIADNGETDSLKMNLSGSLVLEIATCRTLAVNLSGPVGALEVHGPPSGQFEVASEGDIRVAVQADYSATRR